MTVAALPVREPVARFNDLLAGEVRAHLARRRLSNRDFAKMLGAQPSWVDRHLNGATVINADDLERFADALDISIDELTREAIRKASEGREESFRVSRGCSGTAGGEVRPFGPARPILSRVA